MKKYVIIYSIGQGNWDFLWEIKYIGKFKIKNKKYSKMRFFNLTKLYGFHKYCPGFNKAILIIPYDEFINSLNNKNLIKNIIVSKSQYEDINLLIDLIKI